MNKKSTLTFLGLITFLLPMSSHACEFTFQTYAAKPVKDRISKEIGKKVTDEWCKKYTKKYEIVIISSAYSITENSLGHSIVGFRKKGTKTTPGNHRSSYFVKSGNYAISVSYDLAAKTALDSLTDAMSDIQSYLN